MTGSSRPPATANRAGGWPLLLGLLILCYAVAAVGGLAAGDAGDTYASLALPAWAPPSWLFGPVWTVLYATIAVAGWLVARTVHPGRRRAMTAWSLQLALNVAWTPLFFAAGRYGLAFADIALLAVAVTATVLLFLRIDRRAAALLLPYLCWVVFAAALNWWIWVENG
ncbi:MULTISPECIES: TspO/MBR family protein [Streptomyces]|uniref:Tryptophan-rich sensory protein n=1 Tax=Streptomyces fungicidicus TaxID=68203 RepID=A0ACC7Y860_9ACTN|nr:MULTISPECIES: TspO/MBR family protein [Streptomyces]MBF4135004.1 tryptophan-rich sensory protein [Streptomyces albidoflavus]NUV77906.1 tryptophan-rich sensory protein [Streptomyces fungicidicus]PAX83774.1 tryptophan-rich sensory protein [Streptomyces albidoflavus]PBO26392.1 tryptophan-rich sensory protein [Streptomyces albidoflavus]